MAGSVLPAANVNCIKLLLNRCLSKEQQWIIKLASKFQKFGVLSQGCLNDVETMLQDDSGSGENAINVMCEEIRNARGIKGYLEQACNEDVDDFPGSLQICKIVAKLSTCSEENAKIYHWLITSWDDASLRKSELFRALERENLLERRFTCENQLGHHQSDTLVTLLCQLYEKDSDSLERLVGDIKKHMSHLQFSASTEVGAVSPEDNEENDPESSQNDEDWFNDASTFLEDNKDILKGKIEELWPNEPSLLKKNDYPDTLFSKFKEPKEKENMAKFVAHAKDLCEWENTKEWLSKNREKMKKYKDAISPSVDEIWNDSKSLLNPWPGKIVSECKKSESEIDKKKVFSFVSKLKQIFSEQTESTPLKTDDSIRKCETSGEAKSLKTSDSIGTSVDCFESLSEASIQLAWMEENAELLEELREELQARVSKLFPMLPGKGEGDDEFSTQLIKTLEEQEESKILPMILMIQEELGEIQLKWLQDNGNQIRNLRKEEAKFVPFLDSLFLPEKSFGSDEDFPKLLIATCKEDKDGAKVATKVQKIRKEVSKMLQSKSESSAVDRPFLYDHEIEKVEDKHIVEFRVLCNPKVSTMKFHCQGLEILSLKKGDKYLHHELTLHRGAVLKYHYEGEKEFMRSYTAPEEKGTTLGKQCDITGQSWKKPLPLHKFLPSAKKIHENEDGIVSEILHWERFVSRKNKKDDVLQALRHWSSKVLKQQKGKADLLVLIGCVIATAFNGIIRLDDVVNFLCIEKETEETLTKIRRHFQESDKNSMLSRKNLGASLIGLLFGGGLFDVLLVLPLYWHFSNDGKKEEDGDGRMSVETRCCLPGRNPTHWRTRRDNLSKSETQKLWKRGHEIWKLGKPFPWILRSYSYFLTGKQLGQFLADDKLSPEVIPIDILLQRYNENFVFFDKELFPTHVEKLQKSFEAHSKHLARNDEALFDLIGTLQALLNNLKPKLSNKDKSCKNRIAFCCAWLLKKTSDMHPNMEERVVKSRYSLKDQVDGAVLLIIEHVLDSCEFDNMEDLKFGNGLLRLGWEADCQKQFEKCIEAALQKPKKDRDFVVFYIEKVMENRELEGSLETICREAAGQCFTRYLATGQQSKLWELIDDNKIFKFYSRYLHGILQEYEESNFLLHWPHAVGLIEAFYPHKFGKLNQQVANRLKQLIENFRKNGNKIFDGSMLCREFKELFYPCRQRCITLWACIAKQENRASRELEPEIERWYSILEDHSMKEEYIQTFLSNCEKFSGFSVEDERLRKKIQPTAQKNLKDIERLFSDIISGDTMNFLKKNKILKKNTYYQKRYECHASDMRRKMPRHERNVDWEDIVWKIIKPSADEAQAVSERIVNGNLTLKEIAEVFECQGSDMDTAKYITEHIDQFFCLLDKSVCKSDKDCRKEQIIKYFQVRTALKATGYLQQIKAMIKLEGDFNDLKNFDDNWMETVFTNVPSPPMSGNSFKSEDLSILEAFLEQKELVEWLMNHTNDIKDIITLGELARCIVRDDQEADLILALQSSVEGFSPLLYELRKKSSIKELEMSCKEVCKFFGQNKLILADWETAGKEVNWISELVELFGESGKHAMKTIQEINRSGRYIIRKMEKEVLPTLSNYVKLEFGNDHEKNLDDIRDLQSRITLITGEKEGDQQAKEVESFVNLLGTVENLCQVCLDLSVAGCLLFKDLTISISRRPSEKGDHCVDMGVASNATLSERRSMASSAENEIFLISISLNDKAKCLRGCGNLSTIDGIIASLRKVLISWTKTLNSYYSRFYYLNEFSNEQITYLCKALGKKPISELSDQAQLLLAKIHSDLPLGTMNALLREATKEPAHQPADLGEGDETRYESEEWNKTVRILHYQEGQEVNRAKAAVAAAGTDVTNCIEWIYTVGSDDKQVEKFLQEFKTKTAEYSHERKINAKYEVLHARDSRSLEDVLENLQRQMKTTDFASSIWTLYVAFTREAGSLSLDGLLNIEHFGKFLNLLGEKKNQTPNRDFGLEKGKPNIVICDERQIPAATLQLYASKESEPLPTVSEVLLCSENTVESEVKRFFRRALFKCSSNGCPIFCLAAAHKLSHRIAEEAGNHFHDLVKGDINRDYQVVIISSDPNHVLSTCFNQKHIAAKHTDIALLLPFLKAKLKNEIPWEVEKSSVKIVYSHRSGLGKTLHIERMKEKARKEVAENQLRFTTVRFMEKSVEPDLFTQTAIGCCSKHSHDCYHFIHLDATPAVRSGFLEFVFNLFILGSIEDSNGRIWRRTTRHFYITEITHFKDNEDTSHSDNSRATLLNSGDCIGRVMEFLKLLPNTRCLSPCEVLENCSEGIYMDEKELLSEHFQRSAQFLEAYDKYLRCNKGQKTPSPLESYRFNESVKKSQSECLKILLKYCTMKNPSWSQLHHFTYFLSLQLKKYEGCTLFEGARAKLNGLRTFVMHFLIKMAQDFSTPSVKMEDKSAKDIDIQRIAGTRRTWEKASMGLDAEKVFVKTEDGKCLEFHNSLESGRNPFVFFAEDGKSLLFIDVHTNGGRDIVNLFGDVLMKDVLPVQHDFFCDSVKRQGVAMNENFDELTRREKLRVICKVMGIPMTERSASGKWMECLRNIDQSGMIGLREEEHSLSDKVRNWFSRRNRVKIVEREHLQVLEHCKTYGLVNGNKFEEIEEMMGKIVGNSSVQMEFKLKFTRTDIPDPDITYELSSRNVLRILAIYMRLLCSIPVLIVGETGCGKTRMIKFISDLLELKTGMNSLSVLRVHGGISVKDVHDHVKEACAVHKEHAEANVKSDASDFPVLLFFDEANTTEAIYAIKEAMCDDYVQHCGQSWIVAACNPYKKLSARAIEKLSQAGLGYRVKGTNSESGSMPMHMLVYRVVAIPPSLQPFMWDFGQLDDTEEKLYIKQMVVKMTEGRRLKDAIQKLGGGSEKHLPQLCNLVMDVLSHVHRFMRHQEDECKFVSLRDAERSITSYEWFMENASWLCKGIRAVKANYENENDEDSKGKEREDYLMDCMHMLLQVLGLCYHSSLEKRKEFREEVAKFFRLHVPKFSTFSASDFLTELESCQKFIVSHMDVGDATAKNKALLENVYTIAICAELKIPLFLIGKPGSSKSLAKTIVSRSLLGNRSKEEVCQNFKSIDILSFQCSALTQADGIKKIFDQAIDYQKRKEDKSPGKYVAVVALDEIGLAEDSPQMPLKILHSLLESGSLIDKSLKRKSEPSKKVAFLGISNWALDPAKMNRGVFVTRETPDQDELLKTTVGIFHNCDMSKIEPIIELLIKVYFRKVAGANEPEYFGLRDFYSMMKMIKDSRTEKRALSLSDVMNAVLTNFSGEKRNSSSGKTYCEVFQDVLVQSKLLKDDGFNIPSISDTIEANLSSGGRHLLLLTKEHSPLSLLMFALQSKRDKIQIVYGSAFPGDNSNAALCRNINRIKVCMETDCIAVILNLRKIHESLYDTLNQHYVTLGDRKYVDLGLGSSESRVKCRVHDKFRMIFIEDADVVYNEYPIPLINRLEKHHFSSEMFLSSSGKSNAEMLKKWMEEFANVSISGKDSFSVYDAFIGYHEDFAYGVVSASGNSFQEERADALQNFQKCKLVRCATTDSMIRLKNFEFKPDTEDLLKTYFQEQKHENLAEFLQTELQDDWKDGKIFDIVTFSNALMEKDRKLVESTLFSSSNRGSVTLLSLQSFQTMQDFTEKLSFFLKEDMESKVLLIQCSSAHRYCDLISCARHCLTSQITDPSTHINLHKAVIAFLLCTKRQQSNSARNSSMLQLAVGSEIIYLDELVPSHSVGSIYNCLREPVGTIFRKGVEGLKCESGPLKEALDVKGLLTDNLCEALSPLQSNNGKAEARLRILFDALEDESFCQVLLCKIVEVLEERDNGDKGRDSQWLLNEANDKAKLTEAGTIQKTIWLHLKSQLSSALCYIVSIIDEYDNLNLVNSQGQTVKTWKPNLWKMILQSFNFSKAAFRLSQPFETATRAILNGHELCFPFSFFIYKEVTKIWAISNRDKDEFTALLGALPVISSVEKFCLSQSDDAVRMLARDLTLLSYRPRSGCKTEEMDAMIDITLAWCCGSKSPLRLSILRFLKFERYFDHISKILEKWPHLINSSESWLDESETDEEIIMHAFHVLMKFLSEEISGLGEGEKCLKWIDEVRSATEVFGFLGRKTTESEQWKPIALLSGLLVQLVESNQAIQNEEEQEHYLELVGKEVVKIRKVFVPNYANSQNTTGLRTICLCLTFCCRNLERGLLLNWADPNCGFCGNLLEERKRLPCDHYICMDCFTISNTCPTCDGTFDRKMMNDDSTESLSEECFGKLQNFRAKCTRFLLAYITEFINDEDAFSLLLAQFFPLVMTERDGTYRGNQLRIDFFQSDVKALSVILSKAFEVASNEVMSHINKHLSAVLSAGTCDSVYAIILFLQTLTPSDLSLGELVESAIAVKAYPEVCFSMLEHVLRLRSGLQSIAFNINKEVEGNRNVTECWYSELKRLFSVDERGVLQYYFVKYGCERFGSQWIMTLTGGVGAENIFSHYLMDSFKAFDLGQILGEEYTKMLFQVRNFSLTADSSCEIEFYLASFSIAMKNEERLKMFDEELKSRNFPLANDFRRLLALYQSTQPERSSAQKPLMQLLVMVAIAVRKKSSLMNVFEEILQRPESACKLYLPTMPESLCLAAQNKYRTRNTIALGATTSNNLSCSAGEGYLLCGSTLPCHDDPDKRMTRHGVAVTRFILHTCFLIATFNCEVDVQKIIRTRKLSLKDFQGYLLQQLQSNIKELASSLHLSRDDAQIVIFNILKLVAYSKTEEENLSDWSSMESRRGWEQRFRELYLVPVFENLQYVLSNSKNMMTAESDIHRLRSDLPLKEQNPNVTNTWADPTFWRLVRQVDCSDLKRHIIDSPRSNSVILRELLMSHHLEWTRFLIPVVQLQCIMTKRYRYNIEVGEVQRITFGDFWRDGGNDTGVETLLDSYFRAWNDLQQHIWLGHELVELSLESPVSFALPNNREPGHLAKRFTETLIGMHNEFLEKCKELVPELRFEEVSVTDLQEDDIVITNLEKDLRKLMDVCMRYDISYNDSDGARHETSFDLDALEALVRHKYLKHKKLIRAKTIPLMRFSLDPAINDDFRDLKDLIKQETLTPSQEKDVDGRIEANPSAEHYEGVRVLSHTISFLAKTSSAPDRGLKDYMIDTLLVDASRLSVIPVSLRIKHTLALYLHLTWQKAVEFVRQGMDPYQHVLSEGQTDIPTLSLETVEENLRNTNVTKLQKRIHEILITTVDWHAESSLVLDIFPSVSYLDEEICDKAWFENLSESLCFCHIAHLFKMTVKMLDDKK